jgi:S1-C subfamily serine protease
MRRLAVAALAALAAGCGGHAHDTASTRSSVVDALDGDGGFSAQKIYKAEAPGVVTVMSQFDDGDAGEGSGFVLDADGEIATNAHVVTSGEGAAIRRAQAVFVAFADGNRVPARIVGDDPNADVALLKVEPKGLSLKPLPLGDSGKVSVGQPVAAIGSPFGEQNSLSVGVVSAVNRSVASLTDFQIAGAIQTDAAINPGNSGGPLVGPDGRVIGINQQIASESGGGEGVGFAVPVDVVKHSLDQLRNGGEAHYAYLGVVSAELYPQLVKRFNLGVAKGAWVQTVSTGGPAARAGIAGGTGDAAFQGQRYRTGGDVITKVGSTAIASPDDLATAVARIKPGSTVKVEVHRGSAMRVVDVHVTERPLGDPTSRSRG